MTLPIEATLTVDGEPALYSGPGRDGLLRLVNRTASPIAISAPTSAATPTSASTSPSGVGAGAASGVGSADHHVTLHLPAGTLSETSRREVRAVEGWDAVVGVREDGDNRWDAIRLSPRAPLSIPAGGEIVVQLHGLAAAPGGRARHSRVVLDYLVDQQDEPDEPGTPARRWPLEGSRALVLHIVPWQHSPSHLHLAAGVLHGGEVLNRASVANEIEVRLTAEAVLGTVDLVGGQTELQLSWDVGPADTCWWSLCSPAEADGARVELHWLLEGGRAAPDPVLDADVWVSATAATWGIVVPSDVGLAEGDQVAIRVKDLFTAHPTGPANLYLDVVGVGDGAGGAVSGSFVLQVRKQAQRSAGDDGLTILAGPDDPLLEVRNQHGRRALRVEREGDGYALGLYAPDQHRPDHDILGARISSAGDAHLPGGLAIGGPLHIGGPLRFGDSVEVSGDGDTVALSRRGGAAPAGRLRLGAPDTGQDYLLRVRDGVLEATGDLRVAGAASLDGAVDVAGLLHAQGPLQVGGSILGNFTVFGLDTSGRSRPVLRVDGTRGRGSVEVLQDLLVGGHKPLAVRHHEVVVGGDNLSGMDLGWEAFLLGEPVVRATISITVPPLGSMTISHDIPIRATAEGTQWKVEPDPGHWVPIGTDGSRAFRTFADRATGTGRATVLYIRRGLLA